MWSFLAEAPPLKFLIEHLQFVVFASRFGPLFIGTLASELLEERGTGA